MSFGKTLRDARQRRGYTQERLSKLSNVSVNTIIRIENGGDITTLITAELLCRTLGIKYTIG